MTTVAVSDKLHQQRAVAFDNPVASKLDRLPGRDNVHAIDLYRRYCIDVGVRDNMRRTWSPGILSPRVKYSVFEELRSADVPIPYLLFSQTKTHGRSHSFA